MRKEISKEEFERINELSELEKEQLKIAVECIEDIDQSGFPDNIKPNLSNAISLIEEVIEFYDMATSQTFEEIKKINEELKE